MISSVIRAALVHGLTPESWSGARCSRCAWRGNDHKRRDYRGFARPAECPQCGAPTEGAKMKSARRHGSLTKHAAQVRWIVRPHTVWALAIGEGEWTCTGSLALDYTDHDADVLAALDGVDIVIDPNSVSAEMIAAGLLTTSRRITDAGRALVGLL